MAILGPRQCGKSTLARNMIRNAGETVYLDLELPSDIQKLSEPELFFASTLRETELTNTFMIRILPPFTPNIGNRNDLISRAH